MDNMIEIIKRGFDEMMTARQDEKSLEVAALIEEFFKNANETGASSHTVLTMVSGAIGYALGNGCRGAGIERADFGQYLADAQSAMVFSAFDLFENGNPGERETVQ